MIIHIPTKIKYENRKEAKLKMGHYNYNRAQKNGEFLFTYDTDDIVYLKD